MQTTCEKCVSPAAFYVLERRQQPEFAERWLCGQHAREFLGHACHWYAPRVGACAIESPVQCIAHSVAILAIPLSDEACVVYLDRDDGPGTTLCIIGQVESRGIANALLRRNADYTASWPSTYGGMNNIIAAFGGKLASVVVDQMDNSQRYYAKLCIRTEKADTTFVDMRPSDAIALALECGAPIYVLASIIDRTEEKRRAHERK